MSNPLSINLSSIAEESNREIRTQYSADMEWAREISESNQAESKRFFETYYPYLYKICKRYESEQDNAEDLLQECLIKIFQKIGSYKGESSLKTWCSRVCTNYCIDMIRKKAKIQILRDEDLSNEADTENNDIEIELDYYQNILNKISEVFQTMPIGYKTVLNLYVFERKTYAEISEILGVMESTCRSQLFKARKYLMREIEKKGAAL